MTKMFGGTLPRDARAARSPARFRSRTCGSCTSCCCCTWRSSAARPGGALRCRAEAAQPGRFSGGDRRCACAIAVFTLGIPLARCADDAAVLVLLAGHSHAGSVADPADPGHGGFRHGVHLRLAGESRRRRARRHHARLVRAPGARHRRHRLADAHHARHAHGAARPHQDAVRAGLRCRGVGLGARASPAPRCASCPTTAPARRYIADASYWIYLAHLPVVAALAVWVGHWPLHWGFKYPFILVVSFAVLFLSYHFLVRPTFIGKLLNGRKYPSAEKPQRLPRRRPPRSSAGRSRRVAGGSGGRSCAASPRSSARPPRSPASTSKCAAANCWRCSVRMAPASPPPSRCGSDSSKRTPVRSRCSAARRGTSNAAAAWAS